MRTHRNAASAWFARRLIVCLGAAFLSSFGTFCASASVNPCETEILRASSEYGVPVGILYAVGLTETGKKGSLQPNAMNIEGKAVFPSSRAEALRIFANAKTRGARLIDLGCMQINQYYHGSHFASISDMFVRLPGHRQYGRHRLRQMDPERPTVLQPLIAHTHPLAKPAIMVNVSLRTFL